MQQDLDPTVSFIASHCFPLSQCLVLWACLNCPSPQIEHHLFPAISFMHYPAIAKIVEDEATKRGLQYAKYDTLPQILSRFTR